MRRLRLALAAATLALVAACSRTNTPSAPVEDRPADGPLAASVPLRCESRRLDTPAPGSTGPRRIVGSPAVSLHDATLRRLHARGIHHVSMTPHFCLDATGALTCLDFTGNEQARDVAQTIVDAVQAWKFEPYAVHGQGKPFCSQLTFNYTIE
jgi:hypothetical protein